MANQLILDRALDANGYIAPGAKATIYADGTSTLITVYSDVAGTVPATNPIVADANGYWPQRYVSEDAKAVVTTSADVALYTLDPVPTAQGTGAAASQISFTPSVSPPVSATNVQDAIIAAANLGTSGFAAFGLGVTGNATLLANLDATGTGAGVYRFDGTTTGTFPTGVAAGDTGAVELWRQAGATAMMELHHATSNRVFRRRLTTSVWGAWREVINVNQATAEGDIAYRGASDWVRLPKGTAWQALRQNSAATAPEWTGGMGSIVNSTSGTAVELSTSIPASARRLTVLFRGVSLSGTDQFLVQLGNSGGYPSTGYLSTSESASSGAQATVDSTTTGMIIFGSNAARALHGAMYLTQLTTGEWMQTHACRAAVGDLSMGAGYVSGVGVVDRIRIIPTGSNTFDAGSAAVIWE